VKLPLIFGRLPETESGEPAIIPRPCLSHPDGHAGLGPHDAFPCSDSSPGFDGIGRNGSGRRAAEYRADLCRRHRLRRRELQRGDGRADAECRPDRQGRAAVHRRAFVVGDLHAVAVCAVDRRVSLAEEGDRRAPRRRSVDRRAGPHYARFATATGRLQDRHRGQMASRPGNRRSQLERRDFARPVGYRLR